jgi:NAD(P)-dependent dehydrogenase (short-subunit alcohol dehydrogenase family)
MRGKTCLITGASSGLGEAAARALAARGARVVMVCRDRVRGEAARAGIMAGHSDAQVDLLWADLSSQAEVASLAGGILRRYPRLDALIHNAGALFGTRRLSPDGLEMTFALNHMAPFQLTLLLWDLLIASAPARVIVVASRAHERTHLDLDDLQCARRFGPRDAYARSKLANVLFTYELARRLDGTGVTANCLHPGLVATRFGREGAAWYRLLLRLARPIMIGPARGAETMVHLACAPELAAVTGCYFAKRRVVRSAPASYDGDIARRLWEASEALLAPMAVRAGARS